MDFEFQQDKKKCPVCNKQEMIVCSDDGEMYLSCDACGIHLYSCIVEGFGCKTVDEFYNMFIQTHFGDKK